MGCSHPKANRCCVQVVEGVSRGPRNEPHDSETAPLQAPRPYAGVLLKGITTQSHQSEEEMKRRAENMFQDLGLGRGIDATRVKPWLNRTPVQVRPVRFEDLIGTDEGGSCNVYKEVTLSSHSLHWKMRGNAAATITVEAPAPTSPTIEIGVDSDYTRTIIAEKCVIGRRVINRTIGFRDEIEELPFHPLSSPSRFSAGSGKSTFEDQLFKWIRESYAVFETNAESLKDLLHLLVSQYSESTEKQAAEDALVRESILLCKQFIHYLHATHYVTSITLGAAEYERMTENEYLKKMKLSRTFGLDSFVSSRLQASKSSHTAKSTYNFWTIGTIEGEGKCGQVPHSIENEAVIKVETKPIHHLVRDPILGNVLRTAVQEYISEHKDCRIGPFYIASETCGILHEAVTVYLTLDKTYQLCVTSIKAEAMAFSIIPAESKKKNEFHIVYEENEHVKPLGRYYLCTPLTASGTSPSRSPPHFRLRSKRKDCLFVLHSPLHSRGDPAEDLDPWLCGHRNYFIHCSGQRFQNGYLAVGKKVDGENIRYYPTCCSSRNTWEHLSMTFKLLPTGPRCTDPQLP